MLECEKWHVLELLKNGLWLSEVGKSQLTIDPTVIDPTVPIVIAGKQLLWPVDGSLQILASLAQRGGKSSIRQRVGRGWRGAQPVP